MKRRTKTHQEVHSHIPGGNVLFFVVYPSDVFVPPPAPSPPMCLPKPFVAVWCILRELPPLALLLCCSLRRIAHMQAQGWGFLKECCDARGAYPVTGGPLLPHAYVCIAASVLPFVDGHEYSLFGRVHKTCSCAPTKVCCFVHAFSS